MLAVALTTDAHSTPQTFTVTIHISAGPQDAAWVAPIRDFIQEGMERFRRHVPIPPMSITVVVAGTVDDFNRMASPYRAGQVAAVAKPQEKTIIILSPRLRTDPVDLKGTVWHELIHLLLHQTFPPGNVPRWLEEGLAMAWAQDYTLGRQTAVADLFRGGRLIDYPELDLVIQTGGHGGRFSDAYIQALSMVQYLERWLGPAEFNALLQDCRDRPFSESLRRRTGVDVAAFWRNYRMAQWWWTLFWSSTYVLFIFGAFLVVLRVWRRNRRNAKILRQWEEEENDKGAQSDAPLLWDEVVDSTYDWEEDDDGEGWKRKGEYRK